ncbi:hypothetical protein FSP39_003218 [Pinctada imbricata]|uniref:DUF6589 domain-containing protein n=1 Tax=Pinctada imbricata TaxID=66713 RepID=A0AA88XHD4_PINIB|nr:hypothetical protein FSP39_003218 [Pinctada imbricata]
MAAPMKTCTMCMSHIKDRNYRALSSKLSLENYDYAFKCLDFHPREESFACSLCTNKLNRLCKLNDGVDEKLNKMKEEREKLVGILLKNRGEAQEKRTPRARSGLKRLLSKTPTPKGKSKRALFNTPKHRLVPNSAMFSHQKIGKNRDSSTQTIQTSENFDVKVTAKIAGVDTSKIINEESTKAAIKSILNNRSTTAVMKNFCKNSAYRDAMLHVCCMELKKEIDSVVSKKSDLLKSDIESLTDFNWAFIAGKLRKEAPNLYKLFNEFVTCNSKKESDKLPVVITSLSVLLYGRSRSMNQLQLALGLILDKCGLTKEGLKILHDMGITVASSSIHKQKKKLIKEQEKQISTTMSRYYNTYYPSPENPLSDDLRKYGIEILGDNFDVTITPAKMTMMSQRRSLHWFLTMVKQKRIMAHDVHVSLTTQEERNVLTMPTSAWLPSDEEFISLQENMKFHVKKVLLTYIDFLQPVKKCVPEFINHDFISRTKEKSVILNCDLVEASENTSEGMITILQNVNKLVFQAVGQNQKIKDRIVFGGDVLTNERAFAAQEAMQNAKSDYDMLDGLVHRPEGLHREMNFLLVTNCDLFPVPV